ncbi:methylmalonyl Co-A mutase-associated GTPase MeaB [Mucilaginibacter sp. cycad4]|uniref:methylmalonyl Co-A mutase-associated GTPase MeaB n=1 Tax=Mucilaginibacter sp. cycad4 TaxID=3342096 RepID=UPI002AAAEE32|nr:methylmalonyl Co-A mutase-associated GTPase MeaB [Mucilaginibacter gossypii]WPV00169.1 methylmalonyl Co-A mutase-associated GTPase MeaB [Mucilaginibacter gossypii]
MNGIPDTNQSDDFRVIARALTIVENDLNGSTTLLKSLKFDKSCPVIGITGPPGAGKSTLVNGIIDILLRGKKKVAVLAIDPTSPFNFGSLLGDRIRMASHFNHPDVFIRSLATRGSLGGLSAKTIEMADVLKAAGFDYVLIETVGVGQSEVEITGLADITLVVLVPEAGDEIQHIKSGLMEIADAFIINKADREGADVFANNLKKIIGHSIEEQPPIFKTTASQNQGIDNITAFIQQSNLKQNKRRKLLLTEKVYKLIQQKMMAGIDKKKLQLDITEALEAGNFNLYSFVDTYV